MILGKPDLVQDKTKHVVKQLASKHSKARRVSAVDAEAFQSFTVLYKPFLETTKPLK